MRGIDLTNKKYGKLLVIQKAGNAKSGELLWECMCECGSIKIAMGTNLKNGHTKSCGCILKERRIQSKAAKKRNIIKYPIVNIVQEIEGVLCTEEWRDVKGYKGFYQVSDFGRIKRLAVVLKKNTRYGICKIPKPERLHKYHISRNGRPRVELSKNGIQKIFNLSRLVAIAFIPNPKRLPNVCHKDDNPLNNNKYNLFWGTQQDNIDDKCKKQRQARGETGGRVILTEKQVLEIRSKYRRDVYGLKKLSAEYGTTIANISYIITRKNWKHI